MSAFDRMFAAAPPRHVVPPVPADRRSTKRATGALIAALAAALGLTAAAVAAELRRRRRQRQYFLDDIADNDEDEIERQADQIVQTADLSAIDFVVPAAAVALGAVAIDMAARQIDRLNQFADLLQLAPDAQRAALDLAQTSAADMVTQISETTRGMIKNIIMRGVANGQTTDQIADAIATDAAFSLARAELIARTEVSAIDNGGALAAFKVARDKGRLPLRKKWLVDGDPCDECADCADEIANLDSDFSCGVDAPPLHPRCQCALGGYLGDD